MKTNKINLGQTIGILANIGVLAGILLLAYELNQNRELMKAQIRHNLSESIVSQLSYTVTNKEFAELSERVRTNSDALTALDISRYGGYVNMRLRYWENVHYQYRQGLYDEGEYSAQSNIWGTFLREGPVLEIWAQTRDMYSPDFGEELDRLLLTTNSDTAVKVF